MGAVVVVDVAVVGVVEVDVARVGVVEVGGMSPSLPDSVACRDEGSRRCCQCRTCKDRGHHEPCEPESDKEVEEIP